MSQIEIFLPKEISYPMLELRYSKKKGFSVNMGPLETLCRINRLPPSGLYHYPPAMRSMVMSIYEQYKRDGGKECPVGELFLQECLKSHPDEAPATLTA